MCPKLKLALSKLFRQIPKRSIPKDPDCLKCQNEWVPLAAVVGYKCGYHHVRYLLAEVNEYDDDTY